MTRTIDTESEAAERFVRLDASGSPSESAEAATWLARDAANERAFERVELAVELGRRLAADPASPLHAELLRATRPRAARRVFARGLAWAGALAATLGIIWIATPRVPTADRAPVVLPAAHQVTFAAPANPVVVLPSGVIVDASAVAVLPFAAAGDATLARGLERDVAVALRSVPGLYVIAGGAVQPYAGTDLRAADIGAQLGARGLVDAAVELVEGRVHVNARLRETATGALLWQADVDEPVDSLRAVRDALAEGIAAAMLDSSLRAAPRMEESALLAATNPYFQP